MSVHLQIPVLSGGVGRKQTVIAGNESGAFDAIKSNLSTVLEFKSPISSTFPWAWKWLISCSMLEKFPLGNRKTHGVVCIWHTERRAEMLI